MKSKAIILTSLILATLAVVTVFTISRSGHDAMKQPTGSTAKNIESGPDKVAISNYSYISDSITVKAGTTITWTNYDLAKHNVESDTGTELGGPLFGKGQTYSHTFKTVGTFAYHCEPHPYMHGKVIVTQ